MQLPETVITAPLLLDYFDAFRIQKAITYLVCLLLLSAAEICGNYLLTFPVDESVN